jgi:hypothetical protein
MSSVVPRRLTCLASALLTVATCIAACDPLPDECEDDDNVCDGNVANQCKYNGPEFRRTSEREDCGPSRTCVLLADGAHVRPACVRGSPIVECTTEGRRPCFGDLLSTCVRTNDGRLVVLDHPCFWEDTKCVGDTCQ